MNMMLVDRLKRVYGDKNIEMLLAKKMGLSVLVVDNLRNYDMLAGLFFDNKARKHTRKVLIDNSLDLRHRNFYLACLISKIVLSNERKTRAVVIGKNSKIDSEIIAMAKYILGSEIKVDDIIEEHNPSIRPRQYIKLNMSVKEK